MVGPTFQTQQSDSYTQWLARCVGVSKYESLNLSLKLSFFILLQKECNSMKERLARRVQRYSFAWLWHLSLSMTAGFSTHHHVWLVEAAVNILPHDISHELVWSEPQPQVSHDGLNVSCEALKWKESKNIQYLHKILHLFQPSDTC